MEFNTHNRHSHAAIYRVAHAFALALILGCSSQGITGGTAGKLSAAGEPLSQMRVSVYSADTSDSAPIGVGFTDDHGSFHLVTTDASGPLQLPAGFYRWTIDSMGAELVIPPTLSNPVNSSLETQWSGDGTIELVVPPLKPMKVQRP